MRRLKEIILHSDTEYAEFLLGIMSLITGLWLFTPFCHDRFAEIAFAGHPCLWGSMLIFAGATKYIGVLRARLKLRKASCFLACFVWWFLATVFLSPATNQGLRGIEQPLVPLMLGLGLFNALIYLKLSLVSR